MKKFIYYSMEPTKLAIRLFSKLTNHERNEIINYLNDVLKEPASGLSSFPFVHQ